MVLDYEIYYVLNHKWTNTDYQLCSITYKCYVLSLTPKLSIQIASVNIKETCCICVLVMNSDKSVAKKLVIYGR